ncbi:MAG: tRNA (adenosine(37)-N6)-dimethylallyltransferase MiaA [Patescibacteria group bacterium]|nr:tRNA (adenosine(37)-N6)-dimethylallyltransferase MiaA [Patescibacteria group bacterium]
MENLNNKTKIVVILGPTSSGKTGVAIELARIFNGEVISADSRQVYKGMDIGTGKDLKDYEATDNEPEVKYHLIDVANPEDQYDLALYQKAAKQAIADIVSRGKLPIIAGGSGLYLQAIVDGYSLSEIKPDFSLREDLETKDLTALQAILKEKNLAFFEKINNSDLNNKRRLIRYIEVFSLSNNKLQEKVSPNYQTLLIGLPWEREILNQRIRTRLLARLNEGMVAEIEGLNDNGVSWQRLEKFGLEYKWVSRYLQNKIGYEEMVEKLYNDICRFAKRQMTWFRRWEKQGAKIHWINDIKEIEGLVKEFLK